MMGNVNLEVLIMKDELRLMDVSESEECVGIKLEVIEELMFGFF